MNRPTPEPSVHLSDLMWTAITLVVLLWAVGMVVLTVTPPLSSPNSVAADRAIFTSALAVSSTGFSQGFATPSDFKPHIRFLLVGINIVCTHITWVIGGVFVLRLLGRSYRVGLFVVPTIAVMLMCVVPAVMGQGPDAISTLTHWGWDFSGGDVAKRLLPAVAMPLAMVGSVGVALLIAPLLVVKHLPALRASTLWSWTLAAFVVSLMLVGVRQGVTVFMTADGFARSAISAIELRTSYTSLAELNRQGQWLSVVISLIGSAPASSAGGFGVLALALITRSVYRALAGDDDPRRPLAAIAVVWITLTLLLIVVAFLLLLSMAAQLNPDRALLIAISCVTNTGLSQDPIALTGNALYLLSVVIVLGKILPLVMLSWMARRV
jgi:hypothetical protein